MDMSNKYCSKEVFNFNIFDESRNFITQLNTLQENDLIYAKNKTYLKIKDAAIDVDLISHFQNNRDCVYYIDGDFISVNVESGGELQGFLSVPNAKIVNIKISNKVCCFSTVTIIFEIIDSFFYTCNFKTGNLE